MTATKKLLLAPEKSDFQKKSSKTALYLLRRRNDGGGCLPPPHNSWLHILTRPYLIVRAQAFQLSRVCILSGIGNIIPIPECVAFNLIREQFPLLNHLLSQSVSPCLHAHPHFLQCERDVEYRRVCSLESPLCFPCWRMLCSSSSRERAFF